MGCVASVTKLHETHAASARHSTFRVRRRDGARLMVSDNPESLSAIADSSSAVLWLHVPKNLSQKAVCHRVFAWHAYHGNPRVSGLTIQNTGTDQIRVIVRRDLYPEKTGPESAFLFAGALLACAVVANSETYYQTVTVAPGNSALLGSGHLEDGFLTGIQYLLCIENTAPNSHPPSYVLREVYGTVSSSLSDLVTITKPYAQLNLGHPRGSWRHSRIAAEMHCHLTDRAVGPLARRWEFCRDAGPTCYKESASEDQEAPPLNNGATYGAFWHLRLWVNNALRCPAAVRILISPRGGDFSCAFKRSEELRIFWPGLKAAHWYELFRTNVPEGRTPHDFAIGVAGASFLPFDLQVEPVAPRRAPPLGQTLAGFR